MPSTYMLSKGRVKLPKELRQSLNLKDGDRLGFFFSDIRQVWWLLAQNKSASDFKLNRRLELPKQTEAEEERDAMARFEHERGSMSSEEMDVVIRVLQRKRDAIAQDEVTRRENLKADLTAIEQAKKEFAASGQGAACEANSPAESQNCAIETGEVT